MRAEAFNYLFDRVCDDAKLGAFASGVHKPDGGCFWIYYVNGATVSDINAECDAALIRDDAITDGEFVAIRSAGDSGRYSAIDYGNVVTVDLFGGEQRPIAEAGCVANFPMYSIQSLEYLSLLRRDLDAGDSLRENVTTDFDRTQRRKLFERQMHRCTSILGFSTRPATVIRSERRISD
jgi:hypothetical protein